MSLLLAPPARASRESVPRREVHFAGEVCATVGATTWTTSLIPEDGRYLLPLKAAVRAAEQIEIGDHVIGRVYVGTTSHRSV